MTFTEYATAGVGAGIMLIGAIYRDICRRVGKVEARHDEILPIVITVAADVKHIRQNCPRCTAIGE